MIVVSGSSQTLWGVTSGDVGVLASVLRAVGDMMSCDASARCDLTISALEVRARITSDVHDGIDLHTRFAGV